MICSLRKLVKGMKGFITSIVIPFIIDLSLFTEKIFREMGLDEINWGARSGNLVQLSLFDIKRTKFSSSEVVSDFSIFKRRLVDEVYETKDELQMVCSSTGIFDQFIEALEGLFLRIRKNDNLCTKDKIVIS